MTSGFVIQCAITYAGANSSVAQKIIVVEVAVPANQEPASAGVSPAVASIMTVDKSGTLLVKVTRSTLSAIMPEGSSW